MGTFDFAKYSLVFPLLTQILIALRDTASPRDTWNLCSFSLFDKRNSVRALGRLLLKNFNVNPLLHPSSAILYKLSVYPYVPGGIEFSKFGKKRLFSLNKFTSYFD